MKVKTSTLISARGRLYCTGRAAFITHLQLWCGYRVGVVYPGGSEKAPCLACCSWTSGVKLETFFQIKAEFRSEREGAFLRRPRTKHHSGSDTFKSCNKWLFVHLNSGNRMWTQHWRHIANLSTNHCVYLHIRQFAFIWGCVSGYTEHLALYDATLRKCLAFYSCSLQHFQLVSLVPSFD